MKKVLVSLLVLALATTGVFAAVNFSGEFVAGYNFNYNDKGNGEWNAHVMGQDGDDTNTTKLNLGLADDNGVWTIGLESTFVADGRISGDISLDMMKLFGAESDFGVKLGLNVNDEQTVLRAYSNQTGNNFDRIRTSAGGLWTNLNVSYADFIQVQIAGAPELLTWQNGDMKEPASNSGDQLDGVGDLAISLMTAPLDGLAVSAGWVLKGDGQNSTGNEGAVTAAANVNVGTLAGLDFDLGASASYIYGLGPKNHVVAATVYGGVDVVDVAVEYSYNTATELNYLYAGVNLNVVENMLLDVYFGANDVVTFGDTYFVGGDIGYTVNGVTFQLGIEYAGTGANGAAYNYDYTGLSIVPQVKVAF